MRWKLVYLERGAERGKLTEKLEVCAALITSRSKDGVGKIVSGIVPGMTRGKIVGDFRRKRSMLGRCCGLLGCKTVDSVDGDRDHVVYSIDLFTNLI